MRAAIVTIAAALIASPALATRLAGPQPVAIEQYSAYDVYTQGPSRFDAGSITSVGGSASALLGPAPSVSAIASGKWTFHSSLMYHYIVAGPAGAIVPLALSASLGVTRTTGYSYGSASIDFYGQNQDSVYLNVGPYDAVNSRSFTGVLHVDALAGSEGTIWIRANASVDNGGSASAFVDPVLAIDRDFLATHSPANYSLTFSTGVVNGVAAVPEPAIWAFLVVGFGTVGVAARRRNLAVA